MGFWIKRWGYSHHDKGPAEARKTVRLWFLFTDRFGLVALFQPARAVPRPLGAFPGSLHTLLNSVRHMSPLPTSLKYSLNINMLRERYNFFWYFRNFSFMWGRLLQLCWCLVTNTTGPWTQNYTKGTHRKFKLESIGGFYLEICQEKFRYFRELKPSAGQGLCMSPE